MSREALGVIVGGAVWLRPVAPEAIVVLEARLAARRRWMAETAREQELNAAREAAARDETARRFFGEAKASDDDELPMLLRPQAG